MADVPDSSGMANHKMISYVFVAFSGNIPTTIVFRNVPSLTLQ